MSAEHVHCEEGFPPGLSRVLARLDAYPRSVSELLEVVPELIGEMVDVLHADCRSGDEGKPEIDPEVMDVFVQALQAALTRCLLRDQLLSTRKRLQELALELRAVSPGAPATAADDRPPTIGRQRITRTSSALPDTLTRRELEVLGLMADGCTNAVIAQRLMIADGTAKKHVVRVLGKLGATNRSEAVGRWYRAGGFSTQE